VKVPTKAERRVKIGHSVKPETRDGLHVIAEHCSLSQSQVLDRLVARELKRLKLTP
jgi:hypothetical protein